MMSFLPFIGTHALVGLLIAAAVAALLWWRWINRFRVVVVWRDAKGKVTRTVHDAKDLSDALEWADQYDSTDTVYVLKGWKIQWSHDGLRFGKPWTRSFKHLGSI